MLDSKHHISDEELTGVLEVIYKVNGYDFRDYSRASISRRVQKFIQENGYRNPSELKLALTKKNDVFEQFLKLITVNVTEMFRDPGFYKALKEEVLPMLASYPTIKLWHAGCSTGEEVFSMAILLQEAGLLQRSRIYATDINPSNIEKAKTGIIPLHVMKDYTSNYIQSGGTEDFASYYTARYDNAIIRKDLREKIIFSQHNLVTDQAFNEFQLICCRNVMIYFNRELQNRVLKLFNDSLSTFGYLALGTKESLLFTSVKEEFDIINQQQKIYRRIHQ